MESIDVPRLLPLVTPEMLDAIDVAVVLIDAGRNVVASNRAGAEMLGYTVDELVGKNIAGITHPEDVARWAPLAFGGPEHALAKRCRLLHKDGTYRTTEATARALSDGRIVSVLRAVSAPVISEDRAAERLQFVANAVPALIGYVDTGARYVWGNESYRRWFGYSPESIRGRHVREVLGASAWESVRPYVERALAGEEVTFTHRLAYEKGPARDIQATYVPHLDDDGRVRGFVVLSNDVTEIRAAEVALRRSERLLEQSQSTAHVGSWEVIFAEGPPDARPVHWSDETYRIFGYEPRAIEVTQAVFFDAVHPLDREAMRAVSRAGVASGEPFEKEYRLVRPDGTVRVIHAWTRFERDGAGKPMRMIGTCQDITERRQTEQEIRLARAELELSEERYRSLVGAITSVVWTADAVGKFAVPQPAWEAYTGQTFAEYRGWGWIAAVHEDDRERVEESFTHAARTGVSYRASCRVWHAPNADYRFCESRAVAIRNADGSIREWIGTLVDEHERERALLELREADRRKDEFLAMLSHELRNPLAPILSAAELLGYTEPGDAARASKYRTVITRQAQHMKRLLDDLLDVSRVSQGKIQLRKETLDLRELLMQAVEVSRPLIVEKGQELSIALGPDPLRLEADPTRLVQVFANLLNNAAKYTDVNGHIALSASDEDGEAVVKVRDDGMGMRPELLARAFDLFVQETRSLDRAQGGLGIGLTMVRSLVKMHGGWVRVFSEGPGRGSEFVVGLLLSPRLEAPSARAAPPKADARTRPLRVLVVDDNVDAASSLGSLLELLGHEVRQAHDGPSALVAADALAPELVLLDIGLPGMDGYTVAARLRDAGHDRAMLVALSGYGEDDLQHRSSEAGFDRHLVKPVDFDSLREIISRAARRETAPARHT
ncbi:MAG TPA: PAS domain-containing protein [Polyangiaceae bacterium]|nr:PAS domain-containing protein [Polyangiaceae bacterium]